MKYAVTISMSRTGKPKVLDAKKITRTGKGFAEMQECSKRELAQLKAVLTPVKK